MTQWGTTVTKTKSVLAVFEKVVQAGDAGAAITCSWTNANISIVAAWIVSTSDNVAPTFGTTSVTGVCGPNVAACTPGAVTPAQNGDLVFEACAFGNGASPTFDNSPFPQISSNSTVTGWLGWSGSSGAAVMSQASQHSGGAVYDVACFAGDLEASGAGSVLVGAGPDTGTVSSVQLIQPTVLAANVHSSDVHFAGIVETTPAVAETAPPDIVLAELPTYDHGTGRDTFTIDSTLTVGQLFTVTFGNGAVMSAPAACGASAWASKTTGSFNGVFYKILDSCDLGHSYAFTGASGGVNRGIAVFASNSGATLSVDSGSTCGSLSTTATPPTVPAITTGTNNTTNFTEMFGQAAVVTLVGPSGNVPLWSDNGTAAGASMYTQAASGSSGTQVYSSGSSTQTFLYCHMAIKSNTAAASPWAHTVSAVTNESSTVQLDVWTGKPLCAGCVETFTWASSESGDAFIVDVGNLNTTTPSDANGSLKNEGMAVDMDAPVVGTANDDLALNFTGYSGCAPSAIITGTLLPQVVAFGTKLAAHYMPIDVAASSLAIPDNCGGPEVSATLALKAASAPAQTSSSIRLQQQIEEIFSLAPAPSPPASVGSWFF
jgi:hypothetical protein